MFYTYFDPMYWMFMLPPMLLIIYAQIKVKSNFRRYSEVGNQRRMTGADAAREILRENGIYDVQVVQIRGNLTDNYNPKTKIVSLSEGVFDNSSIAAVGIAAHEVGHAIQHATGYAPIKVRNAIYPVSSLGSMIGPYLIIAGFFFNMVPLVNFGLIFFAFAVLFQLITLPVEFNASKRAMETITNNNFLYDEEAAGARKVLTAAALTYVAALLQSVMMLLYFFMRGQQRRD